MGKDVEWKSFFQDNHRYADIINGIGCGGVQLVKDMDLTEVDSTVKKKSRDILRKVALGVNFAIIGIENQEEMDYEYPLRNMQYDVDQYQRQAAELRKEVRANPTGLEPGEYMYGFKKDSKLNPLITFVLYAGEKAWDGPTCLHDMIDFTDVPDELKAMVSDYKVNIIDIRQFENTDVFKTDVKQVFDFIRYSEDMDKLLDLVESDAYYKKMDEDAFAEGIEVIPTGCLPLDIALGVGGLPRGRIVEIYGPESSGKTTVALHVIAEAQKLGGTAAFIDAEHALDPIYAQKLGVDIGSMYVSQPDTGEQALEITEQLVRSGGVDIVVIDSVAALTPKAEIDGEMGDAFVGLQARLMSQALRKLTGVTSKSKTLVIFINQLREKVGVMYGNPETTPGGKALKFYSSVRLDVRKVDAIKNGSDIVGNRTKVKVVKNKVAPPFKTAEFDIMYGEGISIFGCLIDAAIETGVIDKSGSWFSYNGDKIGQGKENVKAYFLNHPELADEVDKIVREKLVK